ncbi:MAG: hypothetical protein ABI968_02675 [Acidobacteriota bacterium]
MSQNPAIRRLFRPWFVGLGALALAAAALAGVGQWTSSGPSGANIYSLATDPSAPSRVFALGTDGLLRSGDGGASWANVNPSIQNLYALTLGSAPAAIYALTFEGKVARSDDEGTT